MSNFNITLENKNLLISHEDLPIQIKDSVLKIENHSQGLVQETSKDESGVLALAKNPDIKMSVKISGDDYLKFETSIENKSQFDIGLKKLKIFLNASLGTTSNDLAFFKNGYQSWTQTRSFDASEREMIPSPDFARRMQDNMENISSGSKGEFNADMFGILGDTENSTYLLAGQSGDFNQFCYVRSELAGGNDAFALELVLDFGGKVLSAGESVTGDEIIIIADSHPNRIQDTYFDLVKSKREFSETLPTGWCSWYYYYTKISQQEINSNLEVVADKQVDWMAFVLDDGYQTQVGDWLSINKRFPDGPKNVASNINEKGMIPGIWLAPFSARRDSKLYKKHPEWTLKNDDGTPTKAGWNPLWGVGGIFYAMDITHPGYQEYLKNVIKTIVHEWGFKYLKLDFIYSASIEAKAYDQSLSSAERLKLGLDIVREVAGKDIFILGCGSPLTPAIGKVDAMRIGPDVAPFWFAKYRYHLTSDPHALCTKFAIRSILNRGQMHRKLWINDPDCLMLRDTRTLLSFDERMCLANAIIVSGGMYVLSDKLQDLSDDIWNNLKEIDPMVKECDKGRVWALDYMEREMPELVYNSSGYLAVFNFGDKSVKKNIDLERYLKDTTEMPSSIEDVWNNETVEIKNWKCELGKFKPHTSRLFRIK